MTNKIVTGKTMKRIEQHTLDKLKMPSLILMENAAFGVIKQLENNDYDKGSVLIVCGSGNNGGDGLAVLRQLKARKRNALAILLCDKDRLKRDALLQYDYAIESGCNIVQIKTIEMLSEAKDLFLQADCIIDAMFGIGLSRDIQGVFAKAIEMINDAGKAVISIDLPSGIDADNGKVLGCAINADVTVTFEYAKVGHMLFPGKKHTGKLVVHPIGLVGEIQGYQYINQEQAKHMLPDRPMDAHKGVFGKVAVVAGGIGMAGAGIMSAKACLGTGAGTVTVFSKQELMQVFQTALPEAMFKTLPHSDGVIDFCELFDPYTVLVIGPGLGQQDFVYEAVQSALACSGKKIVVDADGLNALSKRGVPKVKAQAVFTPHIGEMARLTNLRVDEILEDVIGVAIRFARQWGVVVALKQATTVIASPSGRIAINTTGSVSMAKGGTGDVLSGIIAGLMAQGMDTFDSAMLGSYILGRLGEVAEEKKGIYSVLAHDLIDSIPQIMQKG